MAITAAMGDATGLGGFAEKYPERFFDVGIAEQHAVTFAAGLAKAGMRPFVCIYSSFLQRAYDQILEDVCMQELPVTFMIDRAGIVGADGETHHGSSTSAIFIRCRIWSVLAPTSDETLRESMNYAMEQGGPCAIRYPRGEVMTEEEGRIPSLMYYNRTMEYGNTLLADRVEILGVGKMAGTGREVFVRLLEKGRAGTLSGCEYRETDRNFHKCHEHAARRSDRDHRGQYRDRRLWRKPAMRTADRAKGSALRLAGSVHRAGYVCRADRQIWIVCREDHRKDL